MRSGFLASRQAHFHIKYRRDLVCAVLTLALSPMALALIFLAAVVSMVSAATIDCVCSGCPDQVRIPISDERIQDIYQSYRPTEEPPAWPLQLHVRMSISEVVTALIFLTQALCGRIYLDHHPLLRAAATTPRP